MILWNDTKLESVLDTFLYTRQQFKFVIYLYRHHFKNLTFGQYLLLNLNPQESCHNKQTNRRRKLNEC